MTEAVDKLTQNEQDVLMVRVSSVFSPTAPIDRKQLFAGRTNQIIKVLDTIFQLNWRVMGNV